jgi:hypothetical protein
VNFKNFITALIVALLLFVIDVQETHVEKHELVIENFDSLPEHQAEVILLRIQQDLQLAGASQIDSHTLVNGNLTITYRSNLNPVLVLEFFNVPSIQGAHEASVQELLVHVDLDIVVKEIQPASGIPSGCDGALTHELKTDVDRQHGGQRLLALSTYQTTRNHPFINAVLIGSDFYRANFTTQRQVLIPESRAGPVA